MSRKALKIFPLYIGTCSALAGIIATILTDATLKAKDDDVDVSDLASLTGCDAPDVVAALTELGELGIVKLGADFATVGSFAPLGLTINLQECQKGARPLGQGFPRKARPEHRGGLHRHRERRVLRGPEPIAA